MIRLAVVAVVLAGCDVVFGFRDLGPAPDAPIDPLLVTGRYRQIFVMNDASFAPTVGERIYPAGTISFAAILDDGTPSEVTYNADGSLSFPIQREGQAYRFIVNADGTRAEYQQQAATLELASMLAGRPDRLPVGPTTVQFPYPIATGTNLAAVIASTGIYTHTATTLFGPTVSFDWRLASPTGGVVGMLDAGQHDQLFTIELVTDTTSIPSLPFTTIKGVSKTSITQAPGSTAVIAGPQAIVRNTCARFTAPNLDEANRMMAASPRSYIGTAGDWVMFMTPAPATLGMSGAIWVAISSYAPVVNIDIAPTFHDPFTGMTAVVESGAAATFNVQLPSASPLSISNISRRYVLAERGNPSACTSPKTPLTPVVALAGAITLDDRLLDVDGKVIDLDLSRDVKLTWTHAATGQVDSYGVSLQELVVVNGTTALIPRASISVAGQLSAVIDHTMLVPGSTYMIELTTVLGKPNAAAGDWATVQLPFENATMWSRSFQVAAR